MGRCILAGDAFATRSFLLEVYVCVRLARSEACAPRSDLIERMEDVRMWSRSFGILKDLTESTGIASELAASIHRGPIGRGC